jgi:hypothetical protein
MDQLISQLASRERVREAKRRYREDLDFKDWFHREYKPREKGGGFRDNLDLDDDELVDALDEYTDIGQPKSRRGWRRW